jgi:hypothetical protein
VELSPRDLAARQISQRARIASSIYKGRRR